MRTTCIKEVDKKCCMGSTSSSQLRRLCFLLFVSCQVYSRLYFVDITNLAGLFNLSRAYIVRRRAFSPSLVRPSVRLSAPSRKLTKLARAFLIPTQNSSKISTTTTTAVCLLPAVLLHPTNYQHTWEQCRFNSSGSL